jgi:hypothetical protein
MPKKIHQETMCCGSKRCPTVTLFDDGSMEIFDNDAQKNSVGNIKLDPDQVSRLVELANKKSAE